MHCTCNNCNGSVSMNAHYCPHCFARFENIMCPQCHHQGSITKFYKGCPQCGYDGNVIFTKQSFLSRINYKLNHQLAYIAIALLITIVTSFFIL